MIVLHVAPHPDDETLGCAGALLKHRHGGDEVHWLVMTEPAGGTGACVEAIGRAYGFAAVHRLRLPDARLDALPLAELVERTGAVIRAAGPDVVYVPHPGDAHSDHRVAFDAAAACTKAFRYPSVRRVLAYETLSETNFGLDPRGLAFRPNVYIDITPHLEEKLRILGLYDGEIAPHPFPRSVEAARALACLRGAEAGCDAAEAFMLLREIIR